MCSLVRKIVESMFACSDFRRRLRFWTWISFRAKMKRRLLARFAVRYSCCWRRRCARRRRDWRCVNSERERLRCAFIVSETVVAEEAALVGELVAEEVRLSVLREGREEIELNFESRELWTTGFPLPL